MDWTGKQRGAPSLGDPHGFQHESLRSRRAARNPPQFSWNPGGEEENKEGAARGLQDLKELPLPMRLKRAIRQVQQMKVPVVSRWQSWRRSKDRSLRRFREEASSALAHVELWRRSLHGIGGYFGGGVQSYFLFLRFLVLLNLVSFLLIGLFVLVPSVVFQSLQLANQTQAFNSTGVESCLHYDPNPKGLVNFYSYILDVLSGTGFMEFTYLFYGYYQDTKVDVVGGFSYSVPLAYVLTCLFYFLFCLGWIVTRAGGLVQAVVATGGGAGGGYSLQVLAGWDHGLRGDRATRLRQSGLRYQLQMDLEEQALRRQARSRSLAQWAGLISLRALLHLLVLGLIFAAFFAIYKASEASQSLQPSASEQNFLVALLVEYLPSIVITAANFLVPTLCELLARLEGYSPTTQVILALLRSVFLRFASLGVLLFSLWSQITCSGNTEAVDCQSCQYNYRLYQCWETRVGQEMYKLTIFDFLTVIAVTLLVEFPRRMIVDHCSCKLAQWLGRQEFVVPQNVLSLVYGQTVVWAGALFCPLLPLINTVKFIIFFYCKKVTLFQNCRPASRTFRSSSSNLFFLLVLLLGLVLACVPLVFGLAAIHPSWACGPFRSLPQMWAVVSVSNASLPPSAQDFLRFLGSQAFAVPLFVVLCVALCYVAALASVYGQSVSLLRAQMQLEGKDKQFLVRQIAELGGPGAVHAGPSEGAAE